MCEIMPADSEPPRPPDGDALQVTAACRVGAELGAHVIKTRLPQPPGALQQAIGFGVPVLVAGGAPVPDLGELLGCVRTAMIAGAAGVAFGRNVWGAEDPAAVVAALRDIVHSHS